MATTIDMRSVCEEGIRRAGKTNLTAADIARAREVWIPEIVNEVRLRARETGQGVLRAFQKTATAVGVVNRRRYALPADYDDELDVQILDGDDTGTAQAGDSAAVTLASSEDIGEAAAEGAYYFALSGQSAGQYRQIVSYNTTTKVATVEFAWDAGKTPLSGDTYRIITRHQDIDMEWVAKMEEFETFDEEGLPTSAAIFKDELMFDRPLDASYGILMRYYADPAQTSLDDEMWTSLAKRWQSFLTFGVKLRAYEDLADDRQNRARIEYETMMAGVVLREQPRYGEVEQWAVAYG